MEEPVYRLPPDWALSLAITPLAEVIDPFQGFLGVSELQAKTAGKISGRPLIFALLDTGVDMKHKDLQGQVLDAADFTGSMFGPDDRQGHGSWVTGVVVAAANDEGVRGVAYEAKAVHAKVLGDNGAGNDAMIARGLRWAYQKNADVFSLSLGGPAMSPQLRSLFREVSQQKGKFIFCASGNDAGAVNFPAAWPEVVAVGAVDKDGKRTKFTSHGPELDILGPGVDILSTVPGNRYGTMTGTSMAAPIVASIGGLVYAAAVNAGRGDQLDTVEEMVSLLRKTGRSSDDFPLVDPRTLSSQFAAEPVPGARKPPADRVVLYVGGEAFTYLPAP
jgi:subtilisin